MPSGLDIVHIEDDGTVTPMHAVVEDGYLVFITIHFSDYSIVAEPIAKTIPKTGTAVDFNLLVIGGVLLFPFSTDRLNRAMINALMIRQNEF